MSGAGTMRAVVQHGVGGVDVMRLETVQYPREPERDEVLIKIAGCGVCFHDLLVREGTYRWLVELPLVPGHEMAGEVVSRGPECIRVEVGDRVASTNRETCGQCDRCRAGDEVHCKFERFFGHNAAGAYAEYALVRENALSIVPDSIPLEIASIISCAIGTEYHAIREVAGVKVGETVLVTGAGGGLGIHGVQVAKACGANVIGLTTSADKAKRIAEAGADEVVVVERGQRFHEQLLAVAPDGVDVVCDNVGAPVFDSAFRSLAIGGRYVFIGQLTADKVAFNPAWPLLRNTSLLGSNSSTRLELDAILKLVDRGMLKPMIDSIRPIAEAGDAHMRMAAGEMTGRMVLTP
jgi:D-arabinose 1-dehydrogenase-like Zn-dependent alcohol dehydrogenase